MLDNACDIGMMRTGASGRRLAILEAIMRGNVGRPWTNREIERLRKCYPAMSPTELELEFAPRKFRALAQYAHSLNIRRHNRWMAIAAAHVPRIFKASR